MITRPAIFKWQQTEPGIILCAVRWYLRYSLSLREVEELLEERSLNVNHTTVWRWVQYCGPELGQRLGRHLKPTNKSWRVDEIYVRVKGRWCYVYRAIDFAGATIDFLLSAFRDADPAKRLFCKALGDRSHPQPRVINTGLAPIYSSAIPESKKEGTLRTRCRHRPVQYLNNILAQDHRASSSHQTSSECQAGLPRIPGGSANDSRLRSNSYDPERASSMGGRRQPSSPDSVHRQPFRLGSLRTHDRRSAKNLSAFETCNTTLKADVVVDLDQRRPE